MTDHAVLSRGRYSGIARLWRGWFVAVLAVLLAAGGHQAAHSITHGATAPLPWELLAFSSALTSPVAVALTGTRITTWSTGLTTVIGQLVFHMLYSLPYTGSSHLSAGHHHGAPPLPAVTTDQLPQTVETTASADTVMFIAHILAAALTTGVIVYGERSLGAVVSWLLLVPVRLVLQTLPTAPTRPKSVLPSGRVWIPHPRNIAQTRWTRGPPVLA